MAAVYPAGPLPMITVFIMLGSLPIPSHKGREYIVQGVRDFVKGLIDLLKVNIH